MKTAAEIFNFIKKRSVAFIGSVDENGYPNMKAMLKPRKIEGNALYFSTNTSSMRVKQYRESPKASVYFYRKGLFSYEGVMLVGTVEIKTDAETKRSVWKKGDTIYYKGGVTDQDYCVLKFTAQSGRYYKNLATESFSL